MRDISFLIKFEGLPWGDPFEVRIGFDFGFKGFRHLQDTEVSGVFNPYHAGLLGGLDTRCPDTGVKGIEISIDGGDFVAHTAPLRLAKGEHELRCRVTDMAGNVSKTIAGQVLTGGHTDVLMVNVR